MNKLKLKLLRISCHTTDESQDEIYIKRDGKRLWPKSKYVQIKGGTVDVGLLIELEENTKIKLELWDYDTWSRNDHMGDFEMLVNERGGPYSTDLKRDKGSGGRYTLEWEVN